MRACSYRSPLVMGRAQPYERQGKPGAKRGRRAKCGWKLMFPRLTDTAVGKRMKTIKAFLFAVPLDYL